MPFGEVIADLGLILAQAHTRGTDLKFPLNACGALTVGQDQSKDHTVQGMFSQS
jgi:hypothetical protein